MCSYIEHYDHIEYYTTNSGYYTTCDYGTYVYNYFTQCNSNGWCYIQLEWGFNSYNGSEQLYDGRHLYCNSNGSKWMYGYIEYCDHLRSIDTCG